MAITHNKTIGQKRDVVKTIDTGDLASAIDQLRYQEDIDNFDDCYSVKEMSRKLGETSDNVRDIIKDCISNGTCEYAGKRHGVGIDNRTTKTPVYRFKFKNKKRKK